MIRSIEVSDIENGNYLSKKDEVELELSKLNIYVGSNNSGKSRLIRGVLKSKDYLGSKFLNEAKECFRKSKAKFGRIVNVANAKERTLNLNLNDWHQIDSLSEIYDLVININSYEAQGVDLEDEVKFAEKINKKLCLSLRKVYIPTLRGLRTLEKQGDFYQNRTKEDYFGDVENLEIFTGLELYSKLQKMLLGEYEEREKVRDFEKFLSENFFEEKNISLIPRLGKDVVHIRIGEEERPIYELGDGIQSIIILTFPLFENKGKEMLIGIEEPEIYLHPGMQRKLMEVILDKDEKYGFEKFQYLITTHSNHFLDLTLDYPEDVIIYESRKLENGKFEINRKNDNNMLELMDNLGVRNSSVFLANCTIWVEGITDRLYLKEYFKVYQKNLMEKNRFEEDRHYSFVEYSGGNITHWDFLDEKEGMSSHQISNNIFLIADTDGQAGTGSKKDERIKTLNTKLGENFYALEAKEIENTLTPKVIKKVILAKEDNNKKVDKVQLEAIELIQDDYRDKGIGSYIEEVLKCMGLTDHRKYEADSGTIHEKVKFCRIACDNIKSMDDLSKEAKTICEKLYDFIAKANGEKLLKLSSQADGTLSENVS